MKEKKCKCGKRKLGGIRQICRDCGLPLPSLRKCDILSMRRFAIEEGYKML
jgi:hypothetical protein